MSAEEIAHRLQADTENDEFLAAEAFPEMRSAALLYELSQRGKSDPYLSRVTDAYLHFAVRWSTDRGAYEKLAFNVRNCQDVADPLIGSFLDRNNVHLELVERLRHCLARAVCHIERRCGVRATATLETFDPLGYLVENPDVETSIAHGGFRDALDHFKRCGEAEKRAQRCYSNETGTSEQSSRTA